MRERRFFAWVHLYDPHTPYEPPEPFASRYPGQPYLGEIAYTDAGGRAGSRSWLRAAAACWSARSWCSSPTTARASASTARRTHAYFIYDVHDARAAHRRTPWGLTGRSAAPGLRRRHDADRARPRRASPPSRASTAARWRARSLDPARRPSDRAAYSETYFPRYHFGWQHLRALRDGALHLRRRADARALRPPAGPGRDEATSTRPTASARRTCALRLRDQPGSGRAARRPSGKQPRPRDAAAPGRARLRGQRRSTWIPNAVLPDPKDKLPLFAADERGQDAWPRTERRRGGGRARCARWSPRTRRSWTRTSRSGTGWPGCGGPTRRSPPSSRRSSLKPDDEIALGNLAQLLPRPRQAPRTRSTRSRSSAPRSRVEPEEPAVLVPAGHAVPGPRPPRGGAQRPSTRRSPPTRRWARRSTAWA